MAQGLPVTMIIVLILGILVAAFSFGYIGKAGAYPWEEKLYDPMLPVEPGEPGSGGGDGGGSSNLEVIDDETPSAVSYKLAEKVFEDMSTYGDYDAGRKTAYGLFEDGESCVNIPGESGSAKWCVIDVRNINHIYNGNIPDAEIGENECNELKEACLNQKLNEIKAGDQPFCGKWWGKDKDGKEGNVIFANEKVYSEGTLVTCSSDDGTPECSCGYYDDSITQNVVTEYKYDTMGTDVKGIVPDGYNDPSYLLSGFVPSSSHYMLTLARDASGNAGNYIVNYYMVLDNDDYGEVTLDDVATLIANKYNAGDRSAENLGRTNLAGLFTPLTRTIIDINFTSKEDFSLGELRDKIKSKLSFSYTSVNLNSANLRNYDDIYSCLGGRLTENNRKELANVNGNENALDSERFKLVPITIIPNKFTSLGETIKENQKYRIIVTKFLFQINQKPNWFENDPNEFYVEKKIVIMHIPEITE